MNQDHKQEQVQLQETMELDQVELNQEIQNQEVKKEIDTLDKVKKNLYSRIHEFDKDQQELIKKLDDIEELKKEVHKDFQVYYTYVHIL